MLFHRNLLVAFGTLTWLNLVSSGINRLSPYNQHLPDCSKKGPDQYVRKVTKVKGIVCPMVKDETGFLSEWVGFYEMQGFDHVILYDQNSSLPLDEVEPWIKSGYAEIRRDWWSSQTISAKISDKYQRTLTIKAMAEYDCKTEAVKRGIEIFVSLDLDEYLIPSHTNITVMDELAQYFNATKRAVVALGKYNFPAVPHILEPLNLLTIEAYQTRMTAANKMNYYMVRGVECTPDTPVLLLVYSSSTLAL
jgi:Glycosyltransferase family 92